MSYRSGKLQCDMDRDCQGEITHLGQKGYVYCEKHGLQRRYYRPCRKLRPGEIKKLQRGEALARY
jgi:hypothetical protein